MKKLFTCLVASVLALTTFANPADNTLQKPSLKEMMQQQQAQATMLMQKSATKTPVAKAPEVQSLPTAQPIANVASKAEAMDTVDLLFKSFYADPLYFPVEVDEEGNVSGGDWYIVLKNDRYQFIFDIFGAPATSCDGTYTEEDLDITFSWCAIPAANGKTSYYKTCDLTIKSEKLSANLTQYTLDAVVVTTLGVGGEVNGAFRIHATHKAITPSTMIETAFTKADIDPFEDYFTLVAENDSMSLDMTIYTELGVQGVYNESFIDPEECAIVYGGKTYTPMTMEAYFTTGELTTGGVAYVAFMEVLTTDTTFFNIVLQAPIEAKDTVSFTCTNLVLDDSQGISTATIYITASNKDYDLYGAYNSKTIVTPAIYTGTSTSGQAMMYITDKAADKTLMAFFTKLEVKQNRKKEVYVDMEVLAEDHTLYQATLSWYIPEPKDTVNLKFDESAKSLYYIDDFGQKELQLANYTDTYSVAFDILYIDQVMGGDFNLKNLWVADNTTFIVKHEGTKNTYVDFASVNGKIYQKKDSTFLQASVIGYDSVLYNIDMYYTVPTPKDTVSYTFQGEDVEFTNALPQGIFLLQGISEDGKVMPKIFVQHIENEQIEDTFINDGKFDENDFYTSETYIKVFNEVTKEYEEVWPQKATLTVTISKDSVLTAVGEFICDDGILYHLTFITNFEGVKFNEDNADTPLNYTYNPKSQVIVKDYIKGYGMIYLGIMAHDYSLLTSVYFYANEMHPVIGIPEGVYPINNSAQPGTVIASRGIGMEDGLPLESYVCKMYVEGDYIYYDAEGLYMLVKGNITVENVDGKLKVNIDAFNSQGMPVKVEYVGALTDVENIPTDTTVGAVKMIKDGQLVILRNGKTYTITGSVIE